MTAYTKQDNSVGLPCLVLYDRHMNLIVFASPLHDADSVLSCRQGLFDKLRDNGFRRLDGLPEDDILNIVDGTGTSLPSENAVCFIATGGTEELFRERLGELHGDIVLLSDGYHNSLAASFEIASYLDRRGTGARLVNIPLESGDSADTGTESAGGTDKGGFGEIYSPEVLEYLRGSTVGLIGGASPWLISSDVDLAYVSSEFGTRFVDIGIEELADAYRREGGNLSGEAAVGEERLRAAEDMEKALRSIVEKYRLTALTVKCFDLLGSCRTTACLALARLNDDGIVSGCEGDIPALWTMMAVYARRGKVPFMANPSSSDRERLRVDFAHCTVPTSMTESFTLPTHFESGIGVGIAGILPAGRYSAVKIGGRRLDRFYGAEGTVTANTKIVQRCRTQVSFRFDSPEDFDRFFANRLGNHIVLVPAF